MIRDMCRVVDSVERERLARSVFSFLISDHSEGGHSPRAHHHHHRQHGLSGRRARAAARTIDATRSRSIGRSDAHAPRVENSTASPHATSKFIVRALAGSGSASSSSSGSSSASASNLAWYAHAVQ